MTEKNQNTTAMIIASQNQDYVDEGLAEYQDQIHKLQSKSCIGYFKNFTLIYFVRQNLTRLTLNTHFYEFVLIKYP